MSTFAVGILGLFLFSIPLIRSALFEDSFNLPKLFFIFLCVFFVLLPSVSLFGRDRLRFCIPVGIWAFVLWSCMSFFYALSPKLVSLQAMTWMLLALLFFCVINIIQRSSDIFRIFGWMIGAGCITAFWTICEDLTKGQLSGLVTRLPDWRGYLAAGLGNSGHIAGLMGYLLPGLTVLFLGSRRWNWWLFGAMACMAPAFVLTWSVGSSGSAILSVLAVLGFCALTNLRSKLHWKRLIPMGLLGLFVGCFLLLPHPLNPHSNGLWNEAFSSNRWHEGWPTRVAIWETSWNVIKSYPILGAGTGNFQYAFVQQIVPSLQQSPELAVWAGAYTNDAHNEFLQIWAEQGVIGLIFVFMILVSYCRMFLRITNQANPRSVRFCGLISGGAVLAILLDSLMTFPLRLPAHASWLIFFLAIPYALCTCQSGSELRLNATRRKCAFFALAALFLLNGLIIVNSVRAEYHMKRGRETCETVQRLSTGQPIHLWQEGSQAMEEAIQCTAQGDTTGTKYNLGKAKYFASQPQVVEGAGYFQKANEASRSYSNSRSRYCQYLLMQGRIQDAVNLYEETYQLLAASEIPLNLGFAYYLDGQTSKAASLWHVVGERRPILKPLTDTLINNTANKAFPESSQP